MNLSIELYRCRIGLFNCSLAFDRLIKKWCNIHLSKISKQLAEKVQHFLQFSTTIVFITIFFIFPAFRRLINLYEEYLPVSLDNKNLMEDYIPLVEVSEPISWLSCGAFIINMSISSSQCHSTPEWLYIPLSINQENANFLAKYTYGNRDKRGIKLSHWNAGGAHLENKVLELERVVGDFHPHFFGISEANLFQHHCLNNCLLEGYDLIVSKTLNNPLLGVSRVVVYKHDSLVAKVRDDLMSDDFSSIWLEVGFPNKSKFLVCNIYREWQYLGQNSDESRSPTEQLNRWLIFLDQWERALESGKECIVMGDFNLDFLTFNYLTAESSNQSTRLRSLVDELFSRILPYGVKQCVLGATRQGHVGQNDAGLDHIWANIPGKLSPVQSKYIGSDHKMLFVVRYTKVITEKSRYVLKRSYKNFDPNSFLKEVKKISWWNIYLSEDPNEAANKFTSKISSILDKMAPLKTFQTRSKYCPWLSEQTKSLIKHRNEAQQQYSREKTEINLERFRRLRNLTTKQLKKDKINWQKTKLRNSCGNSSLLWKNVLGWLNWSSVGSPTKLFHSGRIYTSPSALAEILNGFFIEKISLIRKKLPNPTDDPLQMLRHLMVNKTAQFSLSPVHPDTVRKIILSLKNSKACGVDNIDTYIIKLMVDEIVPPVTHILNLSIQQAVFPSMYKVAKVIPLLKKGDPLEAKNYRPVALLCIISKIIERAIYLQIVDYMNTNSFFHPNHHGFRSNHSTTTAMIQMYDCWVQAAEDKEITGVCMLDMSAAFDVVDHSILLDKLKLYGFDNISLAWVKNYLSGRTQSVYIDGVFSSYRDVDAGVPQGSILGPLFYLMFTNDFPETVYDCPGFQHVNSLATHCNQCGGLCCFADDSTYSVSTSSIPMLKDKLCSSYNIMSNYLSNNKLKLNNDKTQLLLMATKQRRMVNEIYLDIETGTDVIKPVKTAKLLGVEIQSDMKWSEYILHSDNSLVRQLTKRLAALKMIGVAASFKERLIIANGLFSSKLIYQISLWGGAEDYLINALQKVQNRAVKFVTQVQRETTTIEMLKSCGWLTVRQLVLYHSIILVQKTLQTGYPRYIFERLPTEFTRETRLAGTRCLRLALTKRATLRISEKSFIHRALSSYNQIPVELRSVENISTFKLKLKIWLLADDQNV